MKINPSLKKINTIFYNNLCIIALAFVVLCFWSCIDCLKNVKPISSSYDIKNGQIIGPIKVTKKPVIYQLEADFYGDNSSLDFSAEVLDSNKDTLYEVGKDFWHESGRDSEGYWSESDSKMLARLNFYNIGTYYIRFVVNSQNTGKTLKVTIKKPTSGSYVPYFILGFWLFFISIFAFIGNNFDWIKAILARMNDSMGED